MRSWRRQRTPKIFSEKCFLERLRLGGERETYSRPAHRWPGPAAKPRVGLVRRGGRIRRTFNGVYGFGRDGDFGNSGGGKIVAGISRRKSNRPATRLPSAAGGGQNLTDGREQFIVSPLVGGHSSMVESKLVELAVAGSSPVGHPIFIFNDLRNQVL